jgi:1-phosphofructokinase family hexose kinase
MLHQLNAGSVNRSDHVLHTAGGKGINLARAVVALQGQVLSLGIVGGYAGKFIVSELERECIPSDMLWTPTETRRSTSLVFSEQMQTTVILDSGSSINLDAGDQLIRKIQAYASRAPFLVLTGSLPPSFPSKYYADIVREVRGIPGLRVCLDCSGETLRLAVENGAQVIKVNSKEFQETFSKKDVAWDLRDVHRTFTSLTRSGVELLVITDGSRGAYIFPAGEEPFRVVTQVEKWVNTAGAGDTFMAGLLLGFNRGFSIEEATSYASAAASAKLQQIVCGDLRLEDVYRFLPMTRVERLF